MTIVLIGLMVVAFYFLMIRPQRKRQQKQQETLNSLQPGTRVLLGSGLFGTILRIGDKQAVLELSPGHELTVLKQAIVRVAGPEDDDTPDSVVDTAPETVAEPSTLDLDPNAGSTATGTTTADPTSTTATTGTTGTTGTAAATDADATPSEQGWREYSIPGNDDTDDSDESRVSGPGSGSGHGPGTGGGPGSPRQD